MTSAGSRRKNAYLPPGASCHVIDFSTEHEDVAACVPGEGLIIFRDGRVIGWCDVGDDTVEHIALYFTYQPFCKYYILQFNAEVKVVSHSSPLKVSHTFEDVTKFEISDFQHKGYPQLGLWKIGSDRPCIMDLSSPCAAVSSSNPIESVLSSKLKGLKVGVKKSQNMLEEKRRLRKHCMFQVLGSDHFKDTYKLDKLIPVLGTPMTNMEGDSCNKLFNPTLVIDNCWQRLLNHKWILGCDVLNAGARPLRSLSLSVSGPHPATERAAGVASGATAASGVASPPSTAVEWSVMVASERGCPWAALPVDGVLQPGQRATVVASVPEPAFCSHRLDMEGMLSASLPDGSETWCSVPPWRLAVESVLTGELQPFRRLSKDPDMEPSKELSTDPDKELSKDVLACLVCSRVQLDLRVEGRLGTDARLLRLLQDANLAPVDGVPLEPARAGSWLLVGTGSPANPLHGALLQLDVLASTTCTLRLYFRDNRHVLLLVHRLLDGLPLHSKVSVLNEDLPEVADDAMQRDLVRALDAELRAVAAKTPRELLHPLEVATDLAAQRLRVATATAQDEAA